MPSVQLPLNATGTNNIVCPADPNRHFLYVQVYLNIPGSASAQSGQVQVSSSGGKLSGRFDLQFAGQAAAGGPPPTNVTGTFSCG